MSTAQKSKIDQNKKYSQLNIPKSKDEIYISTENNFLNSSEIKIGKYEEAPDYLKDNEYIRTGYLINCNTVGKVLRSLFKCSNESLNIWSHLLGCISAIILIFTTAIFVKRYCFKDLTKDELKDIKYNLNISVGPWIDSIKNDNIENNEENIINNYHGDLIYLNKAKDNNKENKDLKEYNNTNVNNKNEKEMKNNLDIIVNKTQIIIENLGNKKNAIENVGDYISDLRKVVSKIKKLNFSLTENNDNNNEINNNSNLLEINLNKKKQNDIVSNWNICENKIVNYFIKTKNTDIIKEIVDKEKIPRWPLFVMLSASILMFTFSFTFHWWGIYTKSLYKILSCLDYSGILILISGSCYPPYYYFYYCEKSK